MRALLLIAVFALLAATSRAESSLLSDVPAAFGGCDAVVYDASGKAVGRARLEMREDPDGFVRLAIETHLHTGEVQSLRAELEPSPGGRKLVLASQQTRTLGRDGELIVGMRVDHRRRRAVCTDAERGEVSLDLPARESIANVPLNLVLLPVARGSIPKARFQFLLCRGEPRVLDASAALARRLEGIPGHPGIAEIHYSFEVGGVLSSLIRPFLPTLVFWLDPQARIPWLGHRMPLFPRGPRVTVLREGIALAQVSR